MSVSAIAAKMAFPNHVEFYFFKHVKGQCDRLM